MPKAGKGSRGLRAIRQTVIAPDAPMTTAP
jgi:hypothetical protein